MNSYLLVRPGYDPAGHEWHAVTDCLPATIADRTYVYYSPSVLLWMGDCIRTGYLREDRYEADNSCWLLDGRDAYTAHGVTHWRWLPAPPQS